MPPSARATGRTDPCHGRPSHRRDAGNRDRRLGDSARRGGLRRFSSLDSRGVEARLRDISAITPSAGAKAAETVVNPVGTTAVPIVAAARASRHRSATSIPLAERRASRRTIPLSPPDPTSNPRRRSRAPRRPGWNGLRPRGAEGHSPGCEPNRWQLEGRRGRRGWPRRPVDLLRSVCVAGVRTNASAIRSVHR